MLYNIRRIRLCPFLLVCLHEPVVPCSSSRMRQPCRPLTFPLCPTLAALTTGSCLILIRHMYRPPMLQTSMVRPSYIQNTVELYTPARPLLSMTAKMACYSLTMWVHRQPLNKIVIVCCPGSTMVERTPHWQQDSWSPPIFHCRLENQFRLHLGKTKTYSLSFDAILWPSKQFAYLKVTTIIINCYFHIFWLNPNYWMH